MNRIKTLTLTIVTAIVLHGLTPEWADACETCNHHGNALGNAISILFLMAMPIVILSFWAVTMFRLRAKFRESNSQPTA